MSWWNFLGFVVVLYLGINVVFAVCFCFVRDKCTVETIPNGGENHFLRAFFFSVETFGTIGYGTISPAGNFPMHCYRRINYQYFAAGFVTGMFFSRFSRPTAQIKFSENIVITPYKDIKGLMFRLVNIVRASLSKWLLKFRWLDLSKKTDRIVRRFDFMPLEREKVSFFPLAWTVVHPIDETARFIT